MLFFLFVWGIFKKDLLKRLKIRTFAPYNMKNDI